jgi:hypothetical protein
MSSARKTERIPSRASIGSSTSLLLLIDTTPFGAA